MEGPATPTLVQSSSALDNIGGVGGSLACLELSACGARLAGGGARGALRVWSWRAASGWQVAAEASRAHRHTVTAARWGAGGGALLASAGADGAVRVWSTCSASTMQCVRALVAPGAAGVRALQWACAGRGARLAVGHEDGMVRVWAVRRGAVLAVLLAGSGGGALPALAVLAGGALLLTACTEGTLKVYDLVELCSRDAKEETWDDEEQTVPLLWMDGAHDLGALCAAPAPCGLRAATGGEDACVRLWTVHVHSAPAAVLQAQCTLRGHAGAVTALCWRTPSLLASASQDRTARLWSTRGTPACLHAVPAHGRYLTCVTLAPDGRYMITGSGDRTFRTWALAAISLEDELRPPCDAMAHFAVGDLEGIGPVDEDPPESERASPTDREPESEGAPPRDHEPEGAGGDAHCAWSVRAHGGAINCIAAHGDLLATASSDGAVKVWRWAEDSALREEHALSAHRYSALACHFDAAGEVLLTGGLDAAAHLWDVQTGVQMRSLCVGGECGEAAGAGAGGAGGAVRDARLSRQRPPRALLALDDGLTQLWSVTDLQPQPERGYSCGAGGSSCCAWSSCGRVCATGGAAGSLHVLAPPGPRALHVDPAAHDLGVTSCDFLPASAPLPTTGALLLATAGRDSLIKLWTIELTEDESEVVSGRVSLAARVLAHGSGVDSVCWEVGLATRDLGGGPLLASVGGDGWARTWRVTRGAHGHLRLRPAGGVCGTQEAGGARAALATRGVLAVGTLAGWLGVWRLREPSSAREDDDAAPCYWRSAGVARWLREYVTRAPGARMSRSRARALLRRAREARLTGARLLNDPLEDVLAMLLDAPLEDVLETLGSGNTDADEEDVEDEEEEEAQRARLGGALAQLRAAPHRAAPAPHDAIAESAPHALLCPLSHRLLRWPTCAADGFTYERDNIEEWLLAAPPEGAVSPMTGRRLSSSRLTPNHRLMDTLFAFLHGLPHDPPAHSY